MGIVLKQSFKNTIIIYLAFLIGGVNTIIFYPEFLGSKFYGLVVYLLSTSNIIMPFLAFGVHFTMVKFFSSYETKEQKDRFLSSLIFLPLLIALPLGFLWDYFHQLIMNRVTEGNKNIESYTFSIYIISVCCAYFEFFYSWTKVQLNTVFGNVLKELWNRVVVMILLLFVFLEWITKIEFIYYLTYAYILRTIVMMFYAFKVYMPKFHLKLPDNFSEIIKYSAYIILAGSAGAILLDIDKNMIPNKDTIEKVAYYTVAVFMGSFIEAPSRAMTQILQPLTSKSLNDSDIGEVENLYKKSSINLFLVGGLFFLLVNCGVHELFKLMPEKGYAGGELVVLMISIAKLYTMFLGNNGAIIGNSKFYRITLPLGIGMALSVYFMNKLFYFKLDFGTDGLALATLITILFFNTVKLFFVKSKFLITPFTDKSWKMFVIILVLFCSFYFWNFSVPKVEIFNRDISPIFNLILKSILITVLYLFIVIKFSISNQINSIVRRYIKL
ncbi:Membrane protein involved in the export of O-antigen and teichoic acid [Polaribacter sp. Hel1_33_78]|uniref:lipopolysaccharide biosynthesis protein n=1 Tax=Polaribacter sp. Hel1_33_78 TaxID=1336804 RepID=UPI00087D4056|nr:oligosaccharide flippase family protein [Polaribacter sp. Hel1_33_78]SDT97214.1 Membrane protein involved in the export of O-antigen and teichoic acid [Polaribacter sp. Hel1_33_78]